LDIVLSHRLKNIKPSPTLAVSARAAQLREQGKDIISLSAGEPDFDTPKYIKNAAIKALDDGQTKYTAVDGTAHLKQAIIDKFHRENNLEFVHDQILVSCGAKHSLYNLFQAALNPDDEIIIPSPYWASYPDMVMLSGANPVFVEATIDDNFKIKADDLEKKISNKTRMIILNSPSNPAGVYYKKEELALLGQTLIKHPNILIVTDDIYEHILWADNEFLNILNVCPQLYDRTIVVNGVSKAFSMTGWRIGYAAGPKEIIKEMKKIQSQSTSNPNSIAQVAATIALNGDHDFIKKSVDTFKERHDFLFNELKKIDYVRAIESGGTFYIFPDMNDIIKNLKEIKNDVELAEFFLEKAEVAMVPGSAFGSPGCMRISFATSMNNIKEGMKRIKSALQKTTS